MTIARTIADILRTHPYPGVSGVLITDDGDLEFTLDGATVPLDGELWRLDEVEVRLDADGWNTSGLTRRCLLSPSDTLTPEAVHAEVKRVLRLAAESPHSSARLDHRLTDEIDRRKDVEAQLARVTAERDQARQAYLDLSTNNPLRPTVNAIAERLGVCPAEPGPMLAEVDRLKGLADAHAVVSQRLVGAQKEIAERDATIEELRGALESIAANVGLVGSDQWAVGEIVGKVGEATARADKIEDRLRRDDDLRSAIAVAVGLDGSASLTLILDTVARDRPGREISRLSGLLDALAAPVAFGGRRLSTAERAEWALRRWLAEGKECSARMAQLIEAEVMLDCMGVPAYAAVPSDDPGDASEALTVAERLRLYFGAQS